MRPIAVPSPEIWHTSDFALLCEWRKLYRAVEVGVDRAEFAQVFLSRWINGQLYLGVDPYQPYHEMRFSREADFNVASIRFERHARIAKLIRESSRKASKDLQQEGTPVCYAPPYGFVYIDASHKYKDVKQDIEDWWPLVADNGILAGHDWGLPDGQFAGVEQAVLEFAESNDLQVYYTTDDTPQSWYIYKSGMPGSDWVRNTRETT